MHICFHEVRSEAPSDTSFVDWRVGKLGTQLVEALRLAADRFSMLTDGECVSDKSVV